MTDLVDPAKFISKAIHGSGAMLAGFKKKCRTPSVIAVKTLEVDPHNLLENLKAALRQHKICA